MEREGPLNRRLGLAIAVASASVTLAIGVTLGALLGYVHPPGQLEPFDTGAASAPLADSSPADQVPLVLVPVQPALSAARDIQSPAPTHTRLASAGTRPRAVRHEDDDED
jgi:hypothetical protein